MISTLLYVSRSTLLLPADRQIENIVDVSRQRNALAGITGALLYSEVHFAQYVEGPEEAVNALLCRLARDDRHINMTVVQRSAAKRRLFPDWTLAYSGPSFLVEKQVEPLFTAEGIRADELSRHLISILRGLASLA